MTRLADKVRFPAVSDLEIKGHVVTNPARVRLCDKEWWRMHLKREKLGYSG